MKNNLLFARKRKWLLTASTLLQKSSVYFDISLWRSLLDTENEGRIDHFCIHMAFTYAVTAIGRSRNRRRKATKLLIRSGPVSSLLLSELPLNIEAPLETRRSFPGLFALETGCRDMYHNRSGGVSLKTMLFM